MVFRANALSTLSDGISSSSQTSSNSLGSAGILSSSISASSSPFGPQFSPVKGEKYEQTTKTGNISDTLMPPIEANATKMGPFGINLNTTTHVGTIAGAPRWDRCPPNMINIAGVCKRSLWIYYVSAD